MTPYFTCLPLQGPCHSLYCTTSFPANNILSNNHWASRRMTILSVAGFVVGFNKTKQSNPKLSLIHKKESFTDPELTTEMGRSCIVNFMAFLGGGSFLYWYSGDMYRTGPMVTVLQT
ncbi:UNVERIFIED_CONTAM: hypothetical protein K2H54_021362 [Gekko kuhli]